MTRYSLPVTTFLAFALLLFSSASALAGQPRTHDRFFLRLTAGGGYAANSIESGGEKAKFSGLGGDSEVAVGAVVSPNLALHGTFFGYAVLDPDLELSVLGQTGSGTANGLMALSAFGGGVTYYFMPTNAYVSGSIGVGKFMFEPDGGPTAETDNGLAFELTAGKEWWVGNSWGLGVSGAYIFASLPEPGIDDKWKSHSFGVRFSATFN